MAKESVKGDKLNIRQACEAFEISQTCYRYEAKFSDENVLIAELMVRRTRSRTVANCRNLLATDERSPKYTGVAKANPLGRKGKRAYMLNSVYLVLMLGWHMLSLHPNAIAS